MNPHVVHDLGNFGLKIIHIPVNGDKINPIRVLSAEEHERFVKFKSEKRRTEFLSARIALGMINHNLSKEISNNSSSQISLIFFAEFKIPPPLSAIS